MMSSVWNPLPDKENTSLVLKPSTKVRSSGPVKISNRGAIPKKQVFGDLKNTIQHIKAEGDERQIMKAEKSGVHSLSPDGELKYDDWPGSLPANLTVEDNFEDCLLPGLQFSNFELEGLPEIFQKCKNSQITHAVPDSPDRCPQGILHLKCKLELSDEDFYELPPVWDYDI